MRSRCRSCRTMWRFQTATGAQGSQGAPGPAMAAECLAAAHSSSPNRRGGASRGLHDVRAVAAGNPRAVPSLFVGEIWTPQSRCCCGPAKTFSPKGANFCLGVSSEDRSLPEACGCVLGRGLGVAFLNLAEPGPVSEAEDAGCIRVPGRRDPATTPGLYRDKHQAQAV